MRAAVIFIVGAFAGGLVTTAWSTASSALPPPAHPRAVRPVVSEPPSLPSEASAHATEVPKGLDQPEEPAQQPGPVEVSRPAPTAAALGLFAPSGVGYRQAKGGCAATARVLDWAAARTAALHEPLPRGDEWRIPTVGRAAACMARIEPLEPNVPLVKGKVGDVCAKNVRRFAVVEDHKAAMDWDTVAVRQRRVVFLAQACPALLPPAWPRLADATLSDTAPPRRVFVDLGCRRYESSPKWFRKEYPDGGTFELYGVDAVAAYGATLPPDSSVSLREAPRVWGDVSDPCHKPLS